MRSNDDGFIFGTRLVRDGDTVKHYRIRQLDEGGFFIARRTTFRWVWNFELVEESDQCLAIAILQNTPGISRALFQGLGWTVCEFVQAMCSGELTMDDWEGFLRVAGGL